MTQAAESLALRQPLQQLAGEASKRMSHRKRREHLALSLFVILDVFTW